MSNLGIVCRICLAGGNIRLNAITNTPQQEMYEKFTGVKLVTEDGRPQTLCYLCSSQLHRFTKFYNMSQEAEKCLTALLGNESQATIIEHSLHNLALSPVMSMTLPDPVMLIGKAIVKEEPFEELEMEAFEEAMHDDTGDLVIDTDIHDNDMNIDMLDTKDILHKEIADRGIINGIIADNEETDKKVTFAIFTEIHETPHEDTKENINVNADIQETNEVIADNINITNGFADNTEIMIADNKITNGTIAEHRVTNGVNAEITDSEDIADNTETIDTIAILDDDEEFPCDECEKRFNFEHQLKFHKRLHARQTTRNVCVECGRKFTKISSLASHLLNVHNKVYIKDKTKKDKVKNSNKKVMVFECKRCTIKFTNETDLIKHSISHTTARVVLERVVMRDLKIFLAKKLIGIAKTQELKSKK